MKPKIFKYKSITRTVYCFSFLMLIILGFATGDTYTLFEGGTENITVSDYFIPAFFGFLFLMSSVSLVLLLLKSKKTILILNIFYSSFFILLFGGEIINLFSVQEISVNDHSIIIGLCCIILLLVYLINKFRYKEIKYDGIDSIGLKN